MKALRPIERLMDALTDPARRERAAALTFVGYAALWSLYGVIAKSSQDIHFDMGEMVVWSREAGLGTLKHPPLGAWLVKAWFSIFPLADWSYYVFAIVLATFALWVAWRVSEPYLSAEKRVAGVVLLTFIPFFNFHALKYNANTVLIPLWALATWWFLRSFETRSAAWATLAGLGAAAAMLGKYWSIFLLLGLGVAALSDSRRGAYFRSTAPLITIAVGALVLGPHVAWLVSRDFAPFNYAVTAHPSDLASAAWSAAGFVAGTVGYFAVPLLLAFIVTWPSSAAIRDTLWPRTAERRFVLIAFAMPILLPAFAAIAARVGIVSLWSIGAMTLLPVVLLSSPLVSLSRRGVLLLLAAGIAFPVLMVVVSPFVAMAIHRDGLDNNASQYRLVASAIEKAWRATTDKPLRFVGSQTNLVNGVVFYLSDKPATLDIMSPAVTPWADPASVVRDGIAYVCPAEDLACTITLSNLVPAAPRMEVALSRTYFGMPDRPARYIIVIVPPRS